MPWHNRKRNRAKRLLTMTILASSISGVPHLAGFDVATRASLDNIALDKLLVYLIDIVDVSALPALAAQFDVLGFKGMRLATTEAQQREVIKKAIQIKRFAGTPWAIEQALIAIGYSNIQIIENAGTGSNGWAQFRITVNVGNNAISASMIDDIVQMINIYKNKRSHLLDVSFFVNFSDNLSTADGHSLQPGITNTESLFVGAKRFADGTYIGDGSIDASLDTDSLTMTVVNLI